MELKLKVSGGPKHGHIVPKGPQGEIEGIEPGSAVYTSGNEAVFAVIADPNDEENFVLTPLAVGTADLTVTADAKIGDGVDTISGTATIIVEAEEATSLDIEFDD